MQSLFFSCVATGHRTCLCEHRLTSPVSAAAKVMLGGALVLVAGIFMGSG